MSVGGIVGAIFGGIVGYLFGPAGWALYGAYLGFTLGMLIDPLTPDMTPPGTPMPLSAELMVAEVGTSMPDLVGTSKIVGHLLCFGKERVETIMTEVEGAKGQSSPDPYISGYRYYMSWAVGIVTGPIDMLYTIYRNDDIVWEGELPLPETGGSAVVTLEDMGFAVFYFGTNDQVSHPDVGDIIGDDTLNSPYRNLCWCFFNDCYIGEFNRCPSMKFVIRKSPVIAFSESNIIQSYDYNPIHAVWYALHNLAGLPASWLHAADFASAAETLSEDNRGICCLFKNQQSTLDYLVNFNNHMDGILRYGSDGKFHPKLIRNDYIIDDLPLIDEDVILKDPTLNRKSWIDTIAEIKVQYTELLGCLPLPQGPWVAAMAHPGSSNMYVYDSTYKRVIKINTSALPPVCQDVLQLPDTPLDYDMGYGNPGTARGGYCMNEDGTRLWYLLRDGLDCELVEVDITGSYMKIVKTTLFPDLTIGHPPSDPPQNIQDGCSDNIHTYWCPNLLTGRLIKINNATHAIVIDKLFNFMVSGPIAQPLSSIAVDVYDSKLYGMFSYEAMPEFAGCNVWLRWDLNLEIEASLGECGNGTQTPFWQNMVRVFNDGDKGDPCILWHRSYHPFCGKICLTDWTMLYLGGAHTCVGYLLNMLGIVDGVFYYLSYTAPWSSNVGGLALSCKVQDALSSVGVKDTSAYTGHLWDDDCIWTSTSALTWYSKRCIISLFRYDNEQSMNIMTCLSANQYFNVLSEDVVKIGRGNLYGR